MNEIYILKILRGHPGHQYWEEFELKLAPMANVISSLMEIQRHPINRKGEKVTPVVWESGCLEEVCGSCSMLINGYPRQACTALIETYHPCYGQFYYSDSSFIQISSCSGSHQWIAAGCLKILRESMPG